MIVADAVVTALAYLFAGLVLHRALAERLLRFDGVTIGNGAMPERDILFLGILPALALVGAIGTYLALFGLFRADVTILILGGAVLWRWRDGLATLGALRDLVMDGWLALRSFDLIAVLAVAAFAMLAVCLMLLAQLTTANIDVWVQHIPLAQSMVDHSGFIYPQIPILFYANNPLFFHVLFGQMLLFTDHFIAASTISILIYLGFILTLSAFMNGYRGLCLLLAVYFIAFGFSISPGVPTPMTDLPRSCFSILAILFADRYLQHHRVYDLTMAGLLAGAAIAGKYTELTIVVLIGLCLAPLLLRERKVWFHTLGFAAAIVVVAGYWYIKNWVMLGNPIYPFLFAHPGLSDQWLADYMRSMRQAFDPENRKYVTNLLTLQGWHDFGYILYNWFLVGQRQAQIAVGVIILGLLVRPRRFVMLVFCTVVLFVLWYTLMFNHIRWAAPARLLFFSTAVIASIALIQWVASLGLHYAVFQRVPSPAFVQRIPRLRRIWCLRSLVNVMLVGLALNFVFTSILHAQDVIEGFRKVLPDWMDRDRTTMLIGRMRIEDYLNTNSQSYAIYHFIGSHDLRMVLQPFDRGSIEYAAAYNGGRDGHWFVPFYVLPAKIADVDEFVKKNKIRYFIYRTTIRPVEVENFGQAHVDMGYAVLKRLLQRSRLIMTDSFKWSLYEIIDDSANKP